MLGRDVAVSDFSRLIFGQHDDVVGRQHFFDAIEKPDAVAMA
jgi:hypothetical protein